MPELDRTAASFLPPEYNASVESFRGYLRELEFPQDPDVSLVDIISRQFSNQLVAASESVAFYKSEAERDPGNFDTPEGLTRALQLSAFAAIRQDLSHKGLRHVVSMLVGYVEAAGDEAVASKGRELGTRVIEHRARHTASAIFATHRLLFTFIPGVDETDSTWQRALDAHDRTGKRPPVEINDHDEAVIEALIDEVLNGGQEGTHPPIFKPSRSKYVNLFRSARQVRRIMKQDPATFEEGMSMAIDMVERIISSEPTVAELDPNQISTGMRVVAKEWRYLSSAAAVDPSISTDPKALGVIFLGQELKGHDVRNEQMAFNQDVQKIARKERKLLDKKRT